MPSGWHVLNDRAWQGRVIMRRAMRCDRPHIALRVRRRTPIRYARSWVRQGTRRNAPWIQPTETTL
eukprot:358796-Chlamydomonas_euryale.AAC.8